MAIEDVYVISKKADLTEIKEALLAVSSSEDGGGGGEESSSFDMAALKNLAASMTSGGDPTDILELIGADKYYITNLSGSSPMTDFLPRDLTEDNQIKMVILLSPKAQATIPTATTDYKTSFFIQFQYSSGKFLAFQVNEGDQCSQSVQLGPTCAYLNTTNSYDYRMAFASSVGTLEIDYYSNSPVIIFYTTP